MVIKPRVKGFVCTTSHPQGCAENVIEQINRAKSHPPVAHEGRIKNVLVIGGSTGYGLASRIASSFFLKTETGSGAGTLNVCFERPASQGRTASPGWYNTAAFEREANAQGIYAKTVVGDAYSDEVKHKTIATIKNDLPKIDLVIYSLASARRLDPKTGHTYTSFLKPIGKSIISKGLKANSGELVEVQLDTATPEQIESTVKVMGGEDWQSWITLLEEKNLLSDDYLTLAYSYIGPEITHAIYRSGTIGKAKEDLEKTAVQITALSKIGGKAVISVNKALVTQASSAIPVLPLYVSALYRVMKEKSLHEDCLDQILRLFAQKIDYQSDVLTPKVDEKGMIRLDDWEMQLEIQQSVKEIWDQVNPENVLQLIDYKGYQADFYRMFGFNIEGIDYEAEVNENVEIKGLVS